mgnify:CR=1 FL=1
MVSNEEIKRRLELKRKGLDLDEELSSIDKNVQSRPDPLPSREKKIACPECGTRNLQTSKFCITCGTELRKKAKPSNVPVESKSEILTDSGEKKEIKSNTLICPECETKNVDTSRFCIGCGKNLKDTASEVVEETSIKTDSLEVSEKIEDNHKRIELLEEESADFESEEEDLFEEIKKAKELLNIGAITEEEFMKIKNKYLKQFE